MSAGRLSAEPVTSEQVSRAQGQMHTRISAAVEKYAVEIGIDPDYITYCHSEMALQTSRDSPNGLIPFGVNYNEIRDSSYLAPQAGLEPATCRLGGVQR